MVQAAAADDAEIGGFDVFISYDHELARREADDLAPRLADGLRQRGFTVWVDRDLLASKWENQILKAARAAKRIVTLETERYFTRIWCLREFHIGVEEGTLARFQLEPCAPPPDLAERGGKFQAIDARGAGSRLAALVAEKLGIAPSQEPPRAARMVTRKADISALPKTARLIGRRRERDALRAAWRDGDCNIVALHAVGGAGKSAILHDFAEWLLDQGTATRVYAWSAYSQGTNAASGRDVETFITAALKFFGGDPSGLGSVAQAEALADIMAEERSALLLDGLEPLQSPPHVNRGRLTSKALTKLIKRLADLNGGLAALTSRQSFEELETRAARVLDIPLARLDEPDAVDLLKFLGARGRPRDFQAAVREVDGHALSVALVGNYVAATAGGDLAARRDLKFDALGALEDFDEADPTARFAARANKIAEGYLERLQDLEGAAGGGAPEHALLHILGLFDRPADGAAVRRLLAGPAIPGLTDALFVRFELGADGLTERTLSNRQTARQWHFAKNRLRRLGLLAKENEDDPDGLDAHPIIREYFKRRLKDTASEAWAEANERLYRHYSDAAPDLPDTLAQMQPLFHAITHGVAAGHVQECFDEIYYRRMRREHAHFLNHQLGAFEANLAALAAFFEAPWTKPNPTLRSHDQEAALNYAASALRGVGRLADAVAPFRTHTEQARDREVWTRAAIGADNLSLLLLALGRTAEAIDAAEEAVRYADRSDDRRQSGTSRAQLGETLHAAGEFLAADDLFRQAEAMHAEKQPDFPKLYSLPGYQYCDLLLTQGRAQEVLERYDLLLSWRQSGDSLLDRALEELLAARAHAALAQSAPERHLDAAARAFDSALGAFSVSADDMYLPLGHITRAAFRRQRAEKGHGAGGKLSFADLAARDLDDAQEIAEYSGMRLALCDIALERGLLAAGQHRDKRAARAQRDDAAELIEACAYRRRRPVLAQLDAALA